MTPEVDRRDATEAEGANALYDALAHHYDYYELTETTAFLVFEERASIGLRFGEHFEAADIRVRNGDDAVKVDVGDARLAVYPPGETGQASVAFNERGDGVFNPTDVRLSREVRYR